MQSAQRLYKHPPLLFFTLVLLAIIFTITLLIIVLIILIVLLVRFILIARLWLEAVIVLERGQGADFRLEAYSLEVLLQILMWKKNNGLAKTPN